MEKEEEHGGKLQDIWWKHQYINTQPLKCSTVFPTILSLFCSSVALSLFFADFSPPAWRDQSAGASSCWTGSMRGGIQNILSLLQKNQTEAD